MVLFPIARRTFIQIFFSVVIILLFIPLSVFAQLTEDFEQGSKGSYAAGLAELESGSWMFDEALIGNRDGDMYFDSRSARIREDGFIEMQFDFPEGAGVFSFYGANSGFSGDTGGTVQIHYSTDEGSSWQVLGDEIQLTEESELKFHELQADIPQPVRFRVEHRGGNRISIDNIAIEPYVELSENPKLSVRINSNQIQTGEQLDFQPVNTSEISEITFRISNMGEEELRIQNTEFEDGRYFSLSESVSEELDPRESQQITIEFTADEPGVFGDQFIMSTNDPEQPEFSIQFRARAIDSEEIIPISAAREVPFETRVTVGGRVTVANEFEGPAFIEDGTAGIAVFHNPLHRDAERGDSVIVSGPVTEFNPIGGNTGTFLRQISAIPGDSDIRFEIVSDKPQPVEPEIITIQQKISGQFESRLVTIKNASFRADGVLQGNQNYTISDQTGTGELRIDDSASRLIGASIPEEPTDITGVIDRFNGVYQIKPRDVDDIDVQPLDIAGEDIPGDATFDVVTWNVEWFGASDTGPGNVNLQFKNVMDVVNTIDADLYALQEIADRSLFLQLADSLENYRGFVSFHSPRQQTAYLFKPTVVDSLDSGLLSTNQDSFDWAGRLPLFFDFNVTVDGRTERIFSYNIHAKAFGDEPSYNRRQNAAQSLKEYFDENRKTENVLLLGDFNDQLNFSTYNEEISPYIPFIEDDHYFAVTKPLEDRGFASYLAGEFRSMIDHIIVTNVLTDSHIDGAQRVENPSYIPNFVSTTSDHAPVWTRFQFTGEPDEPTEIPDDFIVEPNYPNPFHPQTNIRFKLPEPDNVTIHVYNSMGRRVAILADNNSFSEGEHSIVFDASSLASGLYVYNVTLSGGETITRKMMHVK